MIETESFYPLLQSSAVGSQVLMVVLLLDLLGNLRKEYSIEIEKVINEIRIISLSCISPVAKCSP